MSLVLRNPHSVLAALKTRPQDVIDLILPTQSSSDDWEQVARLAKEAGVRVNSGGRSRSTRTGRGNVDAESSRLSIAEACVQERASLSAEELFRNASKRKQGRGLWLALDSLQDPHNVGAVFRTAAFFGVEGILMTQERSAPMTATVYDVASGGMEYVPFCIQTNLQRAFEVARECGLWILGTSEHAHDSLRSIQLDRPWLLVVGNEERGLRRLTEEACDVLCRIPGSGKVTSLNVSVATGIMIQHLSGGSSSFQGLDSGSSTF